MLTVADIMSTDVLTIRSSVKVVQAIALMQKHQMRSLVVEKEAEDGVYGIVTVRDIVQRVTAKCVDPAHIMVCEIMKRPCVTVAPNLSLPALAQKLTEAAIHRAPVIEGGRLLGIVSVSDIVMKSNIGTVDLPNDLSHKIEDALRHKRLGWNEEGAMRRESEIAQRVLAELCAD